MPLEYTFFLSFSPAELISVDGSIRVTSDEFSVSLLNPQSDAYRQKALKYSQKVAPKNEHFLQQSISVSQVSILH